MAPVGVNGVFGAGVIGQLLGAAFGVCDSAIWAVKNIRLAVTAILSFIR
jgi:hypothetical protein